MICILEIRQSTKYMRGIERQRKTTRRQVSGFKNKDKKSLDKPYLSCFVTIITDKLHILDLECTQYIHKIYVVTAQLQNNY